jgi:hypothetical protein
MGAKRSRRFTIALLAAGCSSSSGGGSSVSSSQAATDGASAFCARVAACAPALTALEWGDTSACVPRLTAELSGRLASTGTSATPSQLEACAQALPNATCDDLLGRNLPAPCRSTPGSQPNGAACGDDSQCAGGHCSVPSQQTCGVCTTLGAAGATCAVDADCDYGLACAGGTCAGYVAPGGVCDATHRCLPTLVCKNGACAHPDAAGASCNAQAGDTCDTLHGVFCNDASGTCQTIAYVSAGAACGIISGTITFCQRGSTNAVAECKGLGGVSLTGACQAAAADGASCDATGGPFCVTPSVCVNGQCKLDDASSCH